MGSPNCPGAETIVAFADGQLSPQHLARVEAHALTCALCQELLAAAMGSAAFPRTAGPLSVAAPPLQRGAAVGRYTILAFVDRGGMGEVYAAYDPELDRKVAIKLLLPGRAHDLVRGQTRLLREAKAMAKLTHVNVVAVHDVGTFAERVFVAMEFVDGLTLNRWLTAQPRGRDEIVSVFTGAARGLGAAHAAGLVHRDFKPGNVMIGADGVVRVMDFGLALAEEPATPSGDGPPPSFETPGEPLTVTGELMGTPAYMAPEQFRRGASSPRTDQFSFCVALYEALYGERPFAGTTIPAIGREVHAGRVRAAPARSAVPAWLRRVLLRGLASGPRERWHSLDALVSAHERDAARAWRRRGVATAAAGLVALSALALVRGGERQASLCLGGPARLAGVWEPGDAPLRPRREAVHASFLASGAPAVGEVWDRVSTLLDRYVDGWLAAYRETCEATHVRHAQTAASLELRMTCLDERRSAVGARGDVGARADREVVSNAINAVHALPTLARCADLEELRSPLPPPPDEATRRRIDEVRRHVVEARALNDAGHHPDAMKQARALVAEARQIGYPPLVAETLALTSATHFAGQEVSQPLSEVEDGVWTGLRGGRDDIAAEMSVRMSSLVGWAGQQAEHDEWSSLARALLERAGPGHELFRAWHLQNEARLLNAKDPQAALSTFEAALALKERLLPPENPDTAVTLAAIADTEHDLGRTAEALALTERAHAMFVQAYGPDSIEAAFTLSNRGEYLIDLGRAEEAVPVLRDAAARWAAQAGATHPNLGYPLTALGRALAALGEPREAAEVLGRALTLRVRGETNQPLVAETRFALAQALWDAGGDRARARALATGAHERYAHDRDDTRATRVADWLAAHGRPPTRRRTPTETPPSPSLYNGGDAR